MENALTKVGSFWISKKAKQEISNISHDISSFSNAVEEKAKWLLNKLKAMKPLPDFLRDYNLPSGLFPRNITGYEFDESRAKLIVYMPSPCEACFKDSSILRYATRIKGTLSRGKPSRIEGLKTKMLVWVKVTHVSVESYKSDKICFSTSGIKMSRPKDAYGSPRDGARVEEF